MVARFDQHSALLASELTGFAAKKRRKPLVEKTQIAGPQRPAPEHLVRAVRADLAQSGGLRSKETFGHRRSAFS